MFPGVWEGFHGENVGIDGLNQISFGVRLVLGAQIIARVNDRICRRPKRRNNNVGRPEFRFLQCSLALCWFWLHILVRVKRRSKSALDRTKHWNRDLRRWIHCLLVVHVYFARSWKPSSLFFFSSSPLLWDVQPWPGIGFVLIKVVICRYACFKAIDKEWCGVLGLVFRDLM